MTDPGAAVARAILSPPAKRRHFDTSHLHADLKGRAVRGGAVTISAQVAKFALQTGSTAVLARLLTPADFGLIAMVSAITGFVAVFKDLGLSMATVQRPEITHEQISVLFWINVLVSIVLTAVSIALAPAIAWFYGEPKLTAITMAVSATFVFGGLSAQHVALLRREMRFVPLAVIDVGSQLCGIVVGIAFAVMGASYWALVAMTATQAVVAVPASWLCYRWWPCLPRRRTGVMPMIRFGGNLTGFTVLNYFTRNLDNVLIGAMLGANPLGIYSKAYNLLLMPIRQINAPMGAVALPALSRLQHKPSDYRRYYLRAIELVAFCGMPIVAFAFVDARNVILALMGSQWITAVPVFRWLAPAAFLGTLNVAPGWLCNSLGYPERQLRWAAFSAPITGIAFAIGLKWGTSGVACAFSASWCILLLVFIVYSCQGSPVQAIDIWTRVWRPATASAAAMMIVAVVNTLFVFSKFALLQCLGDAAIFGIAFIASLMLLPSGARTLMNVIRVSAHLR